MALNIQAFSTLISKLQDSTQAVINNPDSDLISIKEIRGVGDTTKTTWTHSKRAQGGGGEGPSADSNLQVDVNNPNSKQNLTNVVNWLVEVCSILVDKVNVITHKEEAKKGDEVQQKKDLEVKYKQIADETDEIRQRSMRGNLIISSPNNNGKTSLFKQQTNTVEGREEKESEMEMVLRVVKQKTSVQFRKEEIHAFHPIGPDRRNPTSFILKVSNRSPHSNYSILSAGMKTGWNESTGTSFSQDNVYISHQITPKRVTFLKEIIKPAHKKKDIFKYLVDDMGQIKVKYARGLAAQGDKYKYQSVNNK